MTAHFKYFGRLCTCSSTFGALKAEQIFRFHDTDGNGEINRHEFKKMLREARVLTGVDNRTFSRMVRSVCQFIACGE